MYYTSRAVYEFISKQTNDPIVARKICNASWAEFPIFQSDRDFYDKISPVFNGIKYSIPTPTLCPEERQRRRLLFRNERKLYRRKCDATDKDIISTYSPDKSYKVYDDKYRRSDAWDPLNYGQTFDFSKPFFLQFGELLSTVPKIEKLKMNTENCDYNNIIWNSKNCYMCSTTFQSEDCLYSYRCVESKDSIDNSTLFRGESAYECINCNTSYKISFSENCIDCRESYFMFNCSWCSNCFLCANLNNTEYHILNESYTKDEYEDQISHYLEQWFPHLRSIFADFKKKSIKKFSTTKNTTNSIWDYIFDSKDSTLCFNIIDGENIKYCYDSAVSLKDGMDMSMIWDIVELMFEAQASGYNGYHGLFVNFCRTWTNLLYCDYCMYCKNCFWCVGLHNKEYCILNKQYTKEDYELTVSNIITHMQSTGERWEFFHPSLSPFGYNETVANEHFPLTRTEALDRWYKRQDNNYDPIIPEWAKVLKWDDIPWDIATVTDDTLKSIFICEVSDRPFRIIKQELEFYRIHHLPLPRKHPDIRHEERMKLRPWRTLHLRTCDKCDKEMLSVYHKDHEGKVYCEECYTSEVYW